MQDGRLHTLAQGNLRDSMSNPKFRKSKFTALEVKSGSGWVMMTCGEGRADASKAAMRPCGTPGSLAVLIAKSMN